MTPEPPYVDADTIAWFVDDSPLDVVADPTGRAPSIEIQGVGRTFTPFEVRQLAAVLVAAADYCESTHS